VRLSRTFGKPSPDLAHLALASVGRERAHRECVVVGDRLATDIAMGTEAGMDTVLVLTGDSTREDLRSGRIQPTRVIDALPELLG